MGCMKQALKKMTKNTKAHIICSIYQTPKTIIKTTSKLEEKIEDLIKSVNFISEKCSSFEIKIHSMFEGTKMIKIENNLIKL